MKRGVNKHHQAAEGERKPEIYRDSPQKNAQSAEAEGTEYDQRGKHEV